MNRVDPKGESGRTSARAPIRLSDLTHGELDSLRSFTIHLATNSFTDATINSYAAWARRFLFWQRSQPDTTTTLHVREQCELFMATYADVGTATKWAAYNALNGWIRYVEPHCELKIRIRIPNDPPKIIHPPDVRQMRIMLVGSKAKMGRCAFKSYAIVCTFALTGLRATELAKLQLDKLRRNGQGQIISILADRKWGHRQEVPVSEVLAHILEKWMAEFRVPEESPWLFPGRHGNRLTYTAVWKTVKRVGAIIGPHIHPHLLRHWFATELVRQGEALSDVQALMAHRSLSSLSRYLHSDIDRQRACVNALSQHLLGPEASLPPLA